MAKTDNSRAKKRTFPGLGLAAHGLGTIALIASVLSLGQTAWAEPTITRTSGSSFFIDVDTNPLLRGNYVAYQIKNDSTPRSNVWVKLDMPVYSASGTITLAQYEDGIMQLGAMAPNETKTAFFYVYSGESLGQGQSKTISAAHDVIVYEGNPNIASTQITSQNFTITKIEETIEAQSNKISTIVSGPKPPELGGVVTIQITSADTGTVGSNDTIFVSPASFADWPANKFELFETSIILTPSKGAPTTLKDTLSFTYSDTASYTTIFKLRAVGTTQSPTQVSPAMQINSGSQVKHTDTSKYTSNTTSFQPIQSVDSKLQLQKLVNQSQMAAGATVTYTLRLTNSGLQTVIVQDFVDTLPTSPAATTYVAGTSQFHGAAISNPAISGSKLTWAGSFSIPAGQSRDLTYQVTIPNTEGTYTNSAIARIGNTQIDSTLDTSDNAPATATVQVTPLRISGTVFEDVNYGGGAGRTLTSAQTSAVASGFAAINTSSTTENNIAIEGARVELYNAAGTSLLGTTTTNQDGIYTFDGTNITGGLQFNTNYKVRVVNNSTNRLTSNRTRNSGTTDIPVAVQTFRTDASSGTVTAVTTEVGGANLSTTDDAANGTLTSALSVATVRTSAANSFGVDFGYNFNTIVNANVSGQGSLQQFVINSNTLSNTNLDQDANSSPQPGTTAINPAAAEDTSIFMIPVSALSSGVATINYTSGFPADTASALRIIDAKTVIDGRTQTANIGDTNSGQLGVGGTVGVGADGISGTSDDATLSQVNKPEVQLIDSSGLSRGIDIQANTTTIRGIAIYGFGNAANSDDHANIRIGNNFITTLIEGNIIGSTATNFTDPSSNRSGGDNLRSIGGDNGVVRNNLIGFSAGKGFGVEVTSLGWRVENNEVRGNAIGNPHLDGIDIEAGSGQTVVVGNLWIDNQGVGVDSYQGGGSNLIENNTVIGNGRGSSSGPNETAGVRLYSSNNTVRYNLIRDNYGAAVMVVDGRTNNTISKNSMVNNGNVTALFGSAASGQIGIDLLSSGQSDVAGVFPYVTANDNGDSDTGANDLLNFPVFESAEIVGNTLVIKGFARSGATIELFVADASPNPNPLPSGFTKDFGEGQRYLTTLTEGATTGIQDKDSTTNTYTNDGTGATTSKTENRFEFSIPLASGNTLSGQAITSGLRLTATATLASNTSEFGGVIPVTTPVASSPNLLLSKRITAIRSGATTTTFTTVFIPASIPSDPNAAHPNWPTGYLKGGGVTDTPPTATPSPVDPVDSFPLRSNDEIEYTIYFLSSGNLTAQNVKFCDRIPQNLTFVPNAFNTTSPASGGLPTADRGVVVSLSGTDLAYTNVADGDMVQYFPPNSDPTTVYANVNCGGANTNGAIVVNLGAVPHATAPGTPANSYGYIRFRAKVN
jgi:uncharacterized repeat protein (TIGR01451 family)